jgi:two-component system OmpR family sensor kinase
VTRRRWPLRDRLVALVVGLLAVMGTVIGVTSTLTLRSTLMTQLDDRLSSAQARGLRNLSLAPPTTADPLSDDIQPGGLTVPGQSPGTVIVEQVGNHAAGAYITEAGESLDAEGNGVVDLPEELTLRLLDVPADDVARTIMLDDLGRYRVVAAVRDGALSVTGLPMAELDATVTHQVITTILLTLSGLVLIGVGGTLLIRRELRPLERVAATATRVAQLPLHQGEVQLADRVSEPDTDQRTEVGRVGAALNLLLGHVESALGARQASEIKLRHFVADASHELRTPLASIRGYAELVRRMPDEVSDDVLRAMGRVESESIRMTTLVEDLLLLARLDSGRALERVSVDLTVLAADAVADAHAAGQDHIWHLRLPEGTDEDEPAGVLVEGDAAAIHQVLANLLSNARVHTPAGTVVTTTVAQGPDAVTVTVRDTGPGIAPELLNRLFDRFARGDESRAPGKGSTGLGLAIADAVVRAHRGRIEVDGTPGATTFTVTFPTPSEGGPS